MAPLRLRIALTVLAAKALAAAPGSAQPAEASGVESAPPAEPDARELARRHFRTGMKLYQDTNYAGALAEFEVAYRMRPGAGSLQNIALCHKALFRYAEAGEALEQLLQRHADELNEGEQRAVREAIEELKGLVGSILLRVSVPDARVTLNGRALSTKEREAPIRLNVGEHALTADAPGYAPHRQTVRLASGQLNLPIEVKLRPTAGFLNVVSSDPEAFIGVNGYARGQHRWRGPVEPGKEHLVQVYRDGFEPFEKTVSVDLGRTLDVFAELGPPTDADAPPPEVTPSGVPVPKRDPRGFYGLISLSLLGMGETPLDLDPDQTQRGDDALGALGLRGGYRLSSLLAAELMTDFGNLRITDECDSQGADACGDDSPKRSYTLSSFHIGPNLRITSAGDRVRFVGTVGAGLVYHRFNVSTDGSETKYSARGVDPYFAIDAGVGFNFGPWLAEAGLLARIDGATSLKGDFSERDLDRNLGGALPMFGGFLRGGWGQWRPR